MWVRYEENHTVTLGITDFGQFQLEKCCNAFIQKPYSMKELSQAIREVLEKKEMFSVF
jgi:glycine cleavage system H lipoate-binding protein